MIRHFAYFVEHTLSPLIQEIDKVLGKTEDLKNILDREMINKAISTLVELELSKTIIRAVVGLIISLIFAGVVLTILK